MVITDNSKVNSALIKENEMLRYKIEKIHEVWKRNREADQYLLMEYCQEFVELRQEFDELRQKIERVKANEL